MGKVSAEDRERMRRTYDPGIARFIADAAGKRELITYQEMAYEFGGIAQAYGDRLGGITIFCRERGLPLLPVIVVVKGTSQPSKGAVLYEDLGIITELDLKAEQEACFAHDWTIVDFDAS